VITLTVDLGERSYPIHVGRELLGRGDLLREALAGDDVLTVTNETVAPLYLATVEDGLRGLRMRNVVLPDGERYKTWEVMNRIFDALLQHRFGRDCTLVALGGGVVGDITGFAAACYQRGVRFVQLPTTLLAQVDSSVGGKTAVNHPRGKNMIGAFHQPSCVIADTNTLSTLSDRELRAGLAEVVKYGLICDTELFDWLEQHAAALLARDSEALLHVIERSCRIKARIVREDERESGARALLNLGHTFGHAIESGVGYVGWLHGEAVAVGMIMAADLSVRIGLLSDAAADRVRALIERMGLPSERPPELSPDTLLDLMQSDKKTRGGRLRLVLLQAIGDATLRADVDRALLLETLGGNHRRVPTPHRSCNP
jgi:3-dehydroquinate synthase